MNKGREERSGEERRGEERRGLNVGVTSTGLSLVIAVHIFGRVVRNSCLSICFPEFINQSTPIRGSSTNKNISCK